MARLQVLFRLDLLHADEHPKFAKMEYVGGEKVALLFMRHTGQWIGLYDRLSVDECMKAIREDPWFLP